MLSGNFSSNQQNNNTSTINVPSSLSVQQICANQSSGGGSGGVQGGGLGVGHHNGNTGNNNNNNNLVPHSQSAHEIGQVPLTPLAQHQQALHHQLQLRFANVNSNSSGKGSVYTKILHLIFIAISLPMVWFKTL